MTCHLLVVLFYPVGEIEASTQLNVVVILEYIKYVLSKPSYCFNSLYTIVNTLYTINT